MKGSTLLKVVSIIMIIGGAISFFLSLLAGALGSLFEAAGVSIGVVWLTIILALLSAVAEVVAGIIGVSNWNRIDKASLCMTWGIIVIAICVVSNIASIVLLSESIKVYSIVSGLLLPVLYVIGANQNKQLSATGSN